MARPDHDQHRPAQASKAAESMGDHLDEPMDEEEKVLANRPDANMPALLTKDVPGG
jgi:hypothetical protein